MLPFRNTKLVLISLVLAFSTLLSVSAAPIIALEKPLPEPIARRSFLSRSSSTGSAPGSFGSGVQPKFGKSRKVTEADLERAASRDDWSHAGREKGKGRKRRERLVEFFRGKRL